MPSARHIRWAKFRVLTVSAAAVVILSILAYLLTGGTLLTKRAMMYLYIPDATGLGPGAPVRVDGIGVGKVRSVALSGSTEPNRVVKVTMTVERYRLANGHFPDSLGDLAPQFISALPNDVLTGEPYRYRLTGDGRFVLYSVGWDEKDDGGVSGKTPFDDKQGDWVWEYPAR